MAASEAEKHLRLAGRVTPSSRLRSPDLESTNYITYPRWFIEKMKNMHILMVMVFVLGCSSYKDEHEELRYLESLGQPSLTQFQRREALQRKFLLEQQEIDRVREETKNRERKARERVETAKRLERLQREAKEKLETERLETAKKLENERLELLKDARLMEAKKNFKWAKNLYEAYLDKFGTHPDSGEVRENLKRCDAEIALGHQ